MASGEPAYALRLCEDTRPASGRCALGALNRVLYVRRGALAVGTDSREAAVTADHAWHGVHACEIVAGDTDSTVLRYELIRGAAPLGGVTGGATQGLLEHAIDLDPCAEDLMRADRGDFAPGGVALPHPHPGGGNRCPIAGAPRVTRGPTPAPRGAPRGAGFEGG